MAACSSSKRLDFGVPFFRFFDRKTYRALSSSVMNDDLARKAVSSLEELVADEIASGRPERFSNVELLCQHAKAIDRMRMPRVASYEADGPQRGEIVDVGIGGAGLGFPLPAIRNNMYGPALGDMGDNFRQLMMGVLPAVGDTRTRDRASTRAHLASETRDLIDIRDKLPPGHAKFAELSAKIEANLTTLAKDDDDAKRDDAGSSGKPALASVPLDHPEHARGCEPPRAV